MQILELAFYELLLVLLFLLLFVPAGRIFAEFLLPRVSKQFRFLASFGISALFYAAVLALGLTLGLSNGELSTMLLVVMVSSLCVFLHKGYYREFAEKNIYQGLTLVFLYTLLAVLSVAFPEGNLRDVMWDTTLHLSTLPIDSIIPFNVSRYIIERLDPNLLEVVPSWRMSDRPPLAGALNATVFLILGLEENARWVQSSPGLYFVYQSLLSFLNALAILAVWIIAEEWCGKRAAIWSVLLLTTSFFFFLNVFFTWPKFFMAYYVLSALSLWVSTRNWPGCGLLFAGAALAHNSALFTLAAFSLCLFVPLFFKWRALRETIPRYAMLVGTFLLLMSPWIAFKKLVSAASPRLVYLHAFCIRDADVSSLTMGAALSRYLEENTWQQILWARVVNTIYPFDPSWVVEEVVERWQGPYYFLHAISHLVFFQLYLGVGIPIFLLMLIGVFRARKESFQPFFLYTLLSCVGAVLFLAVSSGCLYNTVNHQWGYQAFLAICLVAGWYVSKGGFLPMLLAALGVGSNLGIAIIYLFYRPSLKPFLHASPDLISAQLLIIGTFIGLLLYLLLSEPERNLK